MKRLPFLADEHILNVIVTALRSNGFDIETSKDRLEEGATDVELLQLGSALDRVLLTNDRDFVTLAPSVDHAGVVVYVNQELAPGSFVRGIQRLDRYFSTDSMQNHVEWLENWIR